MSNKFRLNATTMFLRTDDDTDESPVRIVFLSVEGNKTESQYFRYLEKNRKKLGIKSSVHVHPLQRAKGDNSSAPRDVLELLEEYLLLRKTEGLPERLRQVVPQKFSDEFVREYLDSAIDENDGRVKKFERILKEAGYDVAYAKFLKEFKGDYDVFGIVIDRDYKSHSLAQMLDIKEQCQTNGYKLFISNPLFEFWLLLHLIDIDSLSEEDMQKIKDNECVSAKHTYTSKLVSEIAGHTKNLKMGVFEEYYLPKIDFAISQARRLNTDIDKLIGDNSSVDTWMGEVGTNLPELFELLRGDVMETDFK